MSKTSDQPFLNVKIKQEKITPPSSPKRAPSNTNRNNEHDSNSKFDLFKKIINDEPIETKHVAEPIKSSNQILAELFQVFNAPPPEVDVLTSKHKKSKKSKKKHKKEKKSDKKSKKKHKKHKKTSKDSKSDKIDGMSNDNSSTSSDSSLENADELNEKTIKKELKRPKTRDIDEQLIPEKRRCHSKTRSGPPEEKQDDEKSRIDKSSSTKAGAITSLSNKIKIKNLSNSEVYKETIKQVEEKEKQKLKDKKKERRHRTRKNSTRHESIHNRKDGDTDSAFTISDEETFLSDYDRNESSTRNRDKLYGDSGKRSSDGDRDKTSRYHSGSGSNRHHDDRHHDDRHHDDRHDRDRVRERTRDFDRDKEYDRYDDRFTNRFRAKGHSSRHDYRYNYDRRRYEIKFKSIH